MPRKNGHKRTREEREKARKELWDLRVIGWSRPQLAAHFNISLNQVDSDLRHLCRETKKERAEEIDEYRDMCRQREWQVRKLAWEEYQLSKRKKAVCRACDEDTQKDCLVCKGEGVIEVIVPGNVNYLKLVHECDEALRAIDGVDLEKKGINLDAAIKINMSMDEWYEEQRQIALEAGEHFGRPDRIKMELERRRLELEKKEGNGIVLDDGEQRVLPIGLKEIKDEETNGTEDKT